MARGSSSKPNSGGSGSTSTEVEMMGRSGSLQNTGRITIRKRFLVENEGELNLAPQSPPGFRPTAVNWQGIGAGVYEKTVDYEYFVAPGVSEVVETIGGVAGRFELDTQDELVPIEKHPNIRKLIQKYKGEEDPATRAIRFPAKYKDGGQEKTNPMAGVRYFTKPAAVFRHIQQMQNIPTNIWTEVGKKVSQLPAGFPHPPDFVNDNGESVKYHWIVLSPQIYRRGNAYEIVRSYKLSEPNVPEELYRTGIAATNTA